MALYVFISVPFFFGSDCGLALFVLSFDPKRQPNFTIFHFVEPPQAPERNLLNNIFFLGSQVSKHWGKLTHLLFYLTALLLVQFLIIVISCFFFNPKRLTNFTKYHLVEPFKRRDETVPSVLRSPNAREILFVLLYCTWDSWFEPKTDQHQLNIEQTLTKNRPWGCFGAQDFFFPFRCVFSADLVGWQKGI